MPSDRDKDPERKQDFPEKPAPRLRPTGLLRELGDAVARRPTPQITPPVLTKSGPQAEKHRAAQAERDRLRQLQDNGRKVTLDQHERAINHARQKFDDQNREKIKEIDTARQAILDRRSGPVRKAFNRFSGRSGQDEAHLQEINEQQQQLDERRSEHLHPLLVEQFQELSQLERGYAHERDNLERDIQRDIYGGGPREEVGRGKEEHDDGGRER